MTFRAAVWYPIAVVLAVANLAAAGFAAGSGEPVHATVHVSLALAFGWWAERLRQRRGVNESQPRLEELEEELSNVRRELNEVQERLDFAERLLAQQESRRVGPER
jgi:uncharacterized membrane protein YhiD involved in acid resistance